MEVINSQSHKKFPLTLCREMLTFLSRDIIVGKYRSHACASVTFFSPIPSKQTDRPIDPGKERPHP
jgi:hypothetical protein